MMRRVGALLVCGVLTTGVAYGTETGVSASALAGMMEQAKHSDGFEVRLNVLVTKADGAHPAPFKLAVIGQIAAGKQRLLIRGISPEAVRGRVVAAERGDDGRIRAVMSRAGSKSVAFDPQAKVFASSMVVWDMFSPWWAWSRQSLEGTERINGRECEKIRSFTDDKNSAVQEVESCVDQQAKLSIRTRLFDARHTVIRTTSVEHMMGKGKNGMLGAKKLKISDASKTHTEIEVYAGDEEYQVTAETFEMLDHPIQVELQEAK